MAREPKPEGNGYDKAVLKVAIEKIEASKASIASIMGKAMAECKKHHEEIAEAMADAKAKGVPMKPLKAELKLCEFDEKKRKVVGKLDEDAAIELEMIREALGDLASLPLGQAALAH